MIPEARRAHADFRALAAGGASARSGQALAVIGHESLEVGPLSVAFVDVDRLSSADHRIRLELWPEGRLELSGLGRRFDTFSRELRTARDHTRVARLLAHGVGETEVFDGALLGGAAPRPTELRLYDTHLTLVSEDADPWQLPLGALGAVLALDDPPSVVLETREQSTTVGLLGRRRDAFRLAVLQRWDAQGRLLAALTGHDGFSDGQGVEADRIPSFQELLHRFTAPERSQCASALLAAATGTPRLGFVRLLDPDGEALSSPGDLPDHWASFLLAPAGARTALEILAGVSAATYVFEAGVDQVNRDLQALHFRRSLLALTPDEAVVTPANPHRLALRRLEPLRRLRTSMVARVVHDERWSQGLAAALA